MIRFGHYKNDRKDTLFTVKDGNYIWFGIARCNLKVGDKFDRDLGKTIAQGRALKAQKFFAENQVETEAEDFDIAQVASFFPMGRVKDTQIKNLLQYFHSFGTRK